jgi:hypothetical protein
MEDYVRMNMEAVSPLRDPLDKLLWYIAEQIRRATDGYVFISSPIQGKVNWQEEGF